MKEKWILPDGTELNVNTDDTSPYPSDFTEDDVDYSWYAADFLQFITSILWSVYPSLRPLIKRAADACWKVWEKEAQEYYKTDASFETIIQPVGMIKTERSYRSVVRYYMTDLRDRLEQLLNGMFTGTFYNIE